VETATEAGQGSYGRPVLIVLVCGLILTLLAWGGVEIWGESVDTDAQPTASTRRGRNMLAFGHFTTFLAASHPGGAACISCP